MKVAVIVPVLNAARDWPQFEPALKACLAYSSIPYHDVVFIDSSSTDGTPDLVTDAGFRLHSIARVDFNHGGTRQLGVEQFPDAEIVVFLTQDAMLATPDSIAKLCAVFADPTIACAYGRQLPRATAKGIEAHARAFNYTETSLVRDYDSKQRLGFKSVFFSNSFGAYRRSALMEVGGFSSDVIFGEDTIMVARLHMAGWRTAYVADAMVTHSHSYNLTQEFRRYFDIGTLHTRESWLMSEFGVPNGEGKRFVLSELKYLLHHEPLAIPSAILRTLFKGLGYALGKRESMFSSKLKMKLAMNRTYWSQN